MLKELRRKAREEGIRNIEAVESNGMEMPFEGESIDVVCANMYLHHIEEPDAAIDEIKRILKPGGKVFLADFYEHDNLEMKEKMHDIWQGFKEEDLMRWFGKTGFGDLKLEKLENRLSKTPDNSSGGNSIFVFTAVKL